MARKIIPVAIAYDFDGTLADGNMQERDFIPALGLKPAEFWQKVRAHAKKHDMDEILSYMDLMLREAGKQEHPITREAFRDYGRTLEFFPGVDSWFGRIDAEAKKRGIAIKHYIISSGLREMIEGTSIHKYFEYVFASGFRYDVNGVATWPALAINYTTKAQYLFRINKGIANAWDNSKINKVMAPDERPQPFENMIYIGDGETDIPAMKMTTYQGGTAIAVYPSRKHGAKARAATLVHVDDRADVAVPADYSEGKDLEAAVLATLDRIAARTAFESLADKTRRDAAREE